MLGRRAPALVPRSRLRDIEEFNLARFIGYDLTKEDHWRMLGLDRASCQGHEGAVGNRLAQALRILQHGEQMKDVKISPSEWREVRTKLQEAAGNCTKDLSDSTQVSPGTSALALPFGELGNERGAIY